MSSTANNNQLHWIEAQLATAISGGNQLLLQMDLPKPCWSKWHILGDYWLKAFLIVNPEKQHNMKSG
jgi:hypothetical protein